MLNHTFHWNGHESSEFGIRIERFPNMSRPARKYTVSNAPGRNGNLYDVQDAWEEITQSYEIFAGGQQKNSPKEFIRIMEWLCEPTGYSELTDTYDVDHYREAVFLDSTDIANSWNRYGRATISFRCRPERFLKDMNKTILANSGTVDVSYHTSSVGSYYIYPEPVASAATRIDYLGKGELVKILETTSDESPWRKIEVLSRGLTGWVQGGNFTTEQRVLLVNPTKHIAKPIIRLIPNQSGAPTIKINEAVLYIDQRTYKFIKVDCEQENVVGGVVGFHNREANYNNRTTLTDLSGDTIVSFPNLQSGNNYILPPTNCDVEIDTRFWEL